MRLFLIAWCSTLACHAPSPPTNVNFVTERATIESLDRTYVNWYQVEVSKLNADLDRLAQIEQTWERWLGRVVRLIMIAESNEDNKKATSLAIANEIELARRWLTSLGVFKPKEQGRLGSSDLRGANEAFKEECSF